LLRVEIRADAVQYRLEGNAPLEIAHRAGAEEEILVLEPGIPVRRTWAAVEPMTPAPGQPAGRGPRARR
jgi:hypothetical protein